jgi:UPF0271 protein
VDLNVDAGEGGDDAALVALATSVNVACGLHAGDAPTMAATVAAAARAGCALGAHPSYPDREGFGRRAMGRGPAEIRADVLYQLGALGGICRAAGVAVRHVKVHGALYHGAWRDRQIAEAVARAIAAYDPRLWVYAPPGSALEAAAAGVGLRVAREGFADRGVPAQGGLLSRGTPGAVLADPAAAAARAVRWAREGRVQAVSGAVIDWPVDTLCVHGDTPEAAAVLRAVRGALEAAGVPIAPPSG